jgi:prevent-host-death family protein
MTTVTIHEAKTNLSKLLNLVEGGKEITIARGKTPVARLVPLVGAVKLKHNLGYGSFSELKGKIPNSAFFDPLPADEQKLWDGGE